MTRIDFHTNVPDKIAYACRLVRKACLARNQVVVLAGDAQQLAALNGALWALSDTDYLPHVLAGDALAPHTPVVLTDSDDTSVPLPHHDILINLSPRMPAHFGQFQRLLEIVSQEQEDANAGRKRYAFYKRESLAPNHFVAGKT